MITATIHFELLTPCFAGGARPDQEAELRASAIRGQLRWWFRVLGGFASLRGLSLADQEPMVFGVANRRQGRASPLIVRLDTPTASALASRQVLTPEQWQASLGPASAYLLYPLQRRNRAAFAASPPPRFDLIYTWHGDQALGESVQALVHVLGHLGSLGFRSRRAMGALGFAQDPPPLASAWRHFGQPQQLIVKQMPAQNAQHAIQILAQWLKKWRYSGHRPTQLNPFKPALDFTRKDHNAGLNLHTGEVYRPALGLPLFQRFHQGNSVNWSYNRHSHPGTEGHFASPVILRPYRVHATHWLALVIFVDPHRWPAGRNVFLNGQPRPVSPSLYEAMKNDPALKAFPTTS